MIYTQSPNPLRAVMLALLLLGSAPELRAQVTFYPDRDFGGDPVQVSESHGNLHELHGLGDRVSSIKIAPGWSLVVFEHDSYRGQHHEFHGPWEIRNLQDFKRWIPSGSDWDDCISSCVLLRGGVPAGTRANEGAEQGTAKGLVWRREFYSLDNGESAVLRPPALQGRTISFVELRSYFPSNATKFSFAVEPVPSRDIGEDAFFVAHARQGNSRSGISFALTTWVLPDHVQSQRAYVQLASQQGRNMGGDRFRWRDPNEESMIVIELHRYDSGGDRDVSFVAQPWVRDHLPGVAAVMDYGNKDSEVRMRATHLHWVPREGSARRELVGCQNEVLVGNTHRTIPEAADTPYLFSLIAYVGSTEEYAPDRLDNLPLVFDLGDGRLPDIDDALAAYTYRTPEGLLPVAGGTGESSMVIFQRVLPDFSR